MSRYIEYYEVKTQNGYEYYFMPVDTDAINKENFDNRSTRIWKFDTKTNRIVTIMDRSKDLPELDRAEFFKIQLMAKPAPFQEYYLRVQEIERQREQHKAKKSSTVDQVPDT